jgi:hypothetical protein
MNYLLPTPVSFVARTSAFRQRKSPARIHHRKLIDVILSRSRLTNLGLLLILTFTAFSVLFNLSLYFSPKCAVPKPYHGPQPLGILSTISRGETVRNLDHLIIVPGHAIWTGSSPNSTLDEDTWVLQSYQRGGGRISAFINHIENG